MEFHTFHLAHRPDQWDQQQVYKYEMEMIEYAEELGFDGAWIAEHHFRDYGTCPSIMNFASFVAARTSRIKIGSGIVVLPFHHPLRAAEDAAMVDQLSNGRLMYGFGRGYQSVEFQGFDLSLEEARQRTDESLEIMKLAWGDGPFSYAGKYTRVENVNVLPKPVQKPHPPLWTAAVSPETVAHYAAKGIPFFAEALATFGRCGRAAEVWRKVAAEHGHDPSKAELGVQRGLILAETEEEARAMAERALAFQQAPTLINKASAPLERTGEFAASYSFYKSHYLEKNQALDVDAIWERIWVAGDPDRVRGQIKVLQDLGFKHVMFTVGQAPNVTIEENRRRLRLFAEEVMPHFRSEGSGA
ncbi:MAG: LLM class flavin-dependent oxidoreductase [Gaiella sp.]